MNTDNYNIKKVRRNELIVVLLLSIHFVFMAVGCTRFSAETAQVIMWLCFFLSWTVFLRKEISSRNRALITAFLIQLCIFVYMIVSNDVLALLIPFLTIVMILAFYGFEDIIMSSAVTLTILLIYYIFIVHKINLFDASSIYTYDVPFVNSYFLIYVIYRFLSREREADQHVDTVIHELEDAEKSKDDFLANVSHEIRTPINTITGMSEIVLRKDIPEDVRDYILNIQASGSNLLSVVSDILDFSELQSGKLELVENSYNIASTMNDVINMANSWKLNKDIELIVDIDSSLPSVLIGDESKVKRVLLNIINNAIKFTQEGCVCIRVTYRREFYGINLCFSIKDTGIGIDEFNMEKLFSSFTTLDANRNRKESGLGLGLAIAQLIADKMGGFICVNSEFGKGSEFQFVIPQKVAEDEPIIEIKNPKNLFVLSYITFDQFLNPVIRDEYTVLIHHMNEQLGYNYHMCSNLDELKRRVENSTPTHLFLTLSNYKEDENFFDKLARKTSVTVILEENQSQEIKNKSLIRLFKPFYQLSFAAILNGTYRDDEYTRSSVTADDFVAPSAKVLLVDDNRMNLKVMEGLLRPYQIQCVSCESGMEALDKIESKDYDIIFMDHMMPEMDGLECMQRIRAKNGHYFDDVPIIAVTANAIAGAREMFLESGFQEFLPKPILISSLDRMLRQFLPSFKIMDKIKEEIPAIEEDVLVSNDSEDLAGLGLNVEEGISFCGSREDYLDILRMNYDNSMELLNSLSDSLNRRDYKSYTISIHGLKSSMKMIGDSSTSEMARELESAGKVLDEQYILEHHTACIESFMATILRIAHFFNLPEILDNKVSLNAESKSDLPEISRDEIQTILGKFEEAAYSYDEDTIKELLDSMNPYSYQGRNLSDILLPIRKKVDMSDFISAFDALKAKLGE